MPIIVLAEDGRFQTELANAGPNLVVVDFTATWCGPCQRIAPVFEQLSNKYATGTTFMKVDVDRCPETSASQNVTSMPTFIFYKNKVKLGRVQGADPEGLENKIIELLGDVAVTGSTGDTSVPGHVDLNSFFLKSGCECLNESDDHPLIGCFTPGSSSYLESDCDEQLIINIAFNQPVKLHSIRIDAPEDTGPKVVKLFINQPRTLDFDAADSMEPVQKFELTPKDLTSGSPIGLRFVKFQNVQNLLIFVKNNQTGSETTRIDYMTIIGSPLTATNMGEFKRVAGKKGESH